MFKYNQAKINPYKNMDTYPAKATGRNQRIGDVASHASGGHHARLAARKEKKEKKIN